MATQPEPAEVLEKPEPNWSPSPILISHASMRRLYDRARATPRAGSLTEMADRPVAGRGKDLSPAMAAVDLRPGIVSIGPVLPLTLQELGLSHASAALPTAIPDLLMGAMALPTPWMARRLGRDRIMFSALGLLLLACLSRALVRSTALLLATTVGVGAGIAISSALVEISSRIME